MSNEKIRIGLYGIGLNTYWAQFDGLHERLLGYQKYIAERMEEYSISVIDAGIVDNPVSARETAEIFKEKRVEAIFLFISTYALSSTVLPVVQQVGVPVIVLNIQPVSRIDYSSFNSINDRGDKTGEWLAHCQACSAPEIACVFNKAGIDYHQVTGYLKEDYVWNEIGGWIKAFKVKMSLRNSRFGILGHYYGGMLDVYSDITMLSSVFGIHFEILEMCELKKYRDEIESYELEAKLREFNDEFIVSKDCEDYEIKRAAKTSCALDRLVKKNELGAMAYYYEGVDGNDYEDIVTSVIAGNTLLTGKGIPIAGECEIKNSVAMKILDLLGAGGSFSELYAIDFDDDIVMWGHDGPAHPMIAEGGVGLVPLSVYHGKPGKGLSIQMSVKHGPVTLLSVVQGVGGETFLLFAEGESVAGPVLEIGNTNSRYKFPISARAFVNNWTKAGPSHHCAIGEGHLGDIIEKIANILRIKFIKIC
ncbi:MAG: L-fucose/L-arabinose isomerase family protein [Spirochaetales bacterium]|nr:L-fucose/L-arabinose isomerase family protein [Spirochaetales bacterium]